MNVTLGSKSPLVSSLYLEGVLSVVLCTPDGEPGPVVAHLAAFHCSFTVSFLVVDDIEWIRAVLLHQG